MLFLAQRQPFSVLLRPETQEARQRRVTGAQDFHSRRTVGKTASLLSW
jgi:hypothetical protein